MAQFTLYPDPAPTDPRPKAPEIDADSIIQGLNPSQQEAARAADGPVLIIAGPGSGKTRTLTHRIAWLLATGKARPWEILAITFTNKAAREMRERVLDLVGHEQGKGMAIGTFHAMFARVMRADGDRIGYTSDFSIYDTDDGQRILRELMHRFNIDTQQVKPRSIQQQISGAKNRMISPSEFARTAISPAQVRAAELFEPYEAALRNANALDFDDLLLKPIQLFQNHPDVLAKYQNRWKYIHIDEYQDTNRAQYLLARLLAERHGNLCVVGDDAQSIYSFRGADITNILSFQRDYPQAQTVRLEQNYRSTKRIVRLADSIIKQNSQQLEKDLWTDNAEGDPVIIMESISEKDEAQKFERRIRDVQVRLGYLYKDFAILYRTNAQSRSLEDALRRGNIPYRVVGGVSFYQRKEIKDALAYLRLLVNPNDIASLRRIINTPTRGIGDKTQDHLIQYAAREGIVAWDALERVEFTGLPARATSSVKAFRDIINTHKTMQDKESAAVVAKSLIKASGLLEELKSEHTPENLMRWENVQELLNAITEFSEANGEGGTLSAFLQEVSLLTDADQNDDSDNRVTLMTLHASKGLEFPVVFLGGMEEGLFPLQAAAQDPQELEEERRLFYVGATRAKSLLFLSYARSRYRYGDQQSAIRSRFFEEIDPSVVVTESGQPFNPKSDRFAMRSAGTTSYETMDPHYYRRSLREDQPSQAAVRKKAADRRVVYDEEESGTIEPGMQVEHHLFGEGRVVALDGTGPNAKAVVDFEDVGEKKLILRFARLKRIG
jgi:DNA helicase-2/ATP-dependent DNA helicase PcrA